jgi:hypothetical protein
MFQAQETHVKVFNGGRKMVQQTDLPQAGVTFLR